MKSFRAIIFYITFVLASTMQAQGDFLNSLEQKQLLSFNPKQVQTLTTKEFKLKKGWNGLYSNDYSIDIKQSFKDISAIKFVATYDAKSKKWALFASKKNKEHNSSILVLKYLEPKTLFYIYATKDIEFKGLHVKDVEGVFYKTSHLPEVVVHRKIAKKSWRIWK